MINPPPTVIITNAFSSRPNLPKVIADTRSLTSNYTYHIIRIRSFPSKQEIKILLNMILHKTISSF